MIGRSDWIGDNDEEYVKIATKLAVDIESLASVRRSLRQSFTTSPLLDHRGFARSLEVTLLKIQSEK